VKASSAGEGARHLVANKLYSGKTHGRRLPVYLYTCKASA
jgi:hypothetical protein